MHAISASRDLRAPAESRVPILCYEGVSLRAGRTQILEGVDLEVRRGEVFGLLGPNGSGKSSLIALTCGLQPHFTGTLRFLLEDGAAAGPGDPRLDGLVGVVFQNPSLDAKLPALENLRLACLLARVPKSEIELTARAALERVGLAEVGTRKVAEFSGGMKRRLDLARVLLAKPRLLLLDEPTTGVDESSFRAFWNVLEVYRDASGATIVVATHRPEEAERCTRVALFSKGRIQEVSSPPELKKRLARDVVELTTDEARAPEIAHRLVESFGLPAGSVALGTRPGVVAVESDKAHLLIPRLVEGFPPGTLRSVSLRSASMSDVFLKVTGHSLEK